MRVLMLESHPGVANAAVARMTEAGHTIVRCETADRRYPCRGLAAGDGCPLDEHVDVAVLMQEIGTCHVEHGAVCAARNRVPVVEIDGADVGQRLPITSWTAVAGPGLLAECERAADYGRAHVEAVAERLIMLGVVTPAELEPPDGTVAIAIERGTNHLRMTIELVDSMRDRQTEIVRAARQALRDFDRRPDVIDIAVRSA